ncbi:uncharacterized protein At3g49055 isoform X2 [Lotus japonicus]|uniref:uncharacterized protein At3g49055 isoform X2 n=1 Tax=Lotus japonicus TaxID=34305 RepID=UPI002589093D|nr:uncharacterized protein At3g49055 isoform X2 [Lotus japonicus]
MEQPCPADHVLNLDKVPYYQSTSEGKEDGSVGKEVEDLKQRVERNESVSKALESLISMKDCLSRVIEGLEGEKDENYVTLEGDGERVSVESEESVLLEEARLTSRLAVEVETRVSKYKEMRMKEKRELESSLISLTEENRDINNLLRVSLLEKEALEKRIKGHDHKRMPLLQFAEFGLQKVGFGFMMGGGNNEQLTEGSEASKSDSSECEEEVVSLGVKLFVDDSCSLHFAKGYPALSLWYFSKASTVERIMKNLRLEITQLRRALEESRSDTERLQCLTEKQAKEIVENKHYIKELEDRERILTQNVEEFMMEIKEGEEEVARWKEACELEVKAGKNEIEERDKLKTKAALDISNGKLRLKEELASTAIAAYEAAERSLQLADSGAVELRKRVEELTRQLEEAEKRARSSHKVRRRICWPWQVFKLSSGNIGNSRVGNAKRMLPEMQALLH